MLKLNKANFIKHIPANLILGKHIIVSASLKEIDSMLIEILKAMLIYNELKYFRINDYCIEASSEKKDGRTNVPFMSSILDKEVFTVSLVYSIERKYISFSDIDLKVKRNNKSLLNEVEDLLQEGWEMINL